MNWWSFLKELPSNRIPSDADVLVVDTKGHTYNISLIEVNEDTNEVYIHMKEEI